jgi:hypothetical protein
MIPYLLAIAGGYLIAEATKDKQLFAKGGRTKQKKLYAVLRSPFGETITHIEVSDRDERLARQKLVEMGFTQSGSIYFTENEPYYYAKGGNIKNDWNSLTIDDMAKAFPYKLTKINKILRDLVSKRKVGQINEFSITTNQSHKYDTFANLVFLAVVKLEDTGSDTVTAGGTYFSQKGLVIRFYIRQTYRKDSGYGEISINASKNVAGGMIVYNEKEVNSIYDIEYYISAILKDNKPNNLTDFVY